MTSFWLQTGALFWLALCFFRVGAARNGIPLSWRTWLEIGQAAVIVVALFWLLSDGRGCSGGAAPLDDDSAAAAGVDP